MQCNNKTQLLCQVDNYSPFFSSKLALIVEHFLQSANHNHSHIIKTSDKMLDTTTKNN